MSGVFENTLCSTPYQGDYLATASSTADAMDLSATAALIEREGLRFDGTAGAFQSSQALNTSDYTIVFSINKYSGEGGVISFGLDQGIYAYTSGIMSRVDAGIHDAIWSIDPKGIFAVTKVGNTRELFLNTVSLGAQTVSGSGSISLSQGTYLGSYNSGSGNTTAPLNGTISSLRVFNYALTAAEIAALTRRGLVTLPEQRGGSMVAITAGSFVVGKKYRIVTVGTTSFTGIGASANTIGIEFTATGVGTGDGTALPLGTLFEQDSGQRSAGYMVRDTSGNHANLILPASGVSIINPSLKGGTIEFTTNTNGNQQLGGSQVIIPTNARITSWVINSSGTPTISLGNVSGGAQFVSALSLAATAYNDVTLLTRFCTTGNLWCNSNSTATLKHTIQWEYIQA